MSACDPLHCEHFVALEELRAAVANHRVEITHKHLRWGGGPDHAEDDCDDPDCTHVPQIVSADRELWASAGIEEHYPGWQHPVKRLHGLVDHLRAELADAQRRARY